MPAGRAKPWTEQEPAARVRWLLLFSDGSAPTAICRMLDTTTARQSRLPERPAESKQDSSGGAPSTTARRRCCHSGSPGRSRHLKATTATASPALGAGQQEIQGDELFLGQEHRQREHNASAAAAGGMIGVEWQHNADGVWSFRAALQVTEEDSAGEGKQITAVDPIESQRGGGISSRPANLERGTTRGAAEADGTARFRRRKCSCAVPFKRRQRRGTGGEGIRRASSSPQSCGG